MPDRALGTSLDLLRQESQALRQELAAARMLLHQRAEPVLTAVIDALKTDAAMAAQGHPGAQALISAWRLALKAAEEAPAGGGIVVANGATPRID